MPAPKLSASDWAQIVTLYERGEKTLRQLGEMFDVSHVSIREGLQQRGAVKGSRLSEVAEETADTARAIREEKMRDAQRRSDEYARYNDALVKITMKKVFDANKNGANFSLIHADLQSLKAAGVIIANARREAWDILKLDNLLGEDAKLPDLTVGEYTNEDLEKIRQANEARYLENNLTDEDEDFNFDLDEDDASEA